MSNIKDIIVKLIPKKDADKTVKRYHYSGKVTQNSQLNFGIFLKGVLLGAAQFGPSIDKRRMGKNLGIGMNESLELNRLAISDKLGKNAESRVLGICLRLIKKNYPFIRCVVSFADACQCGDGTIYRASNFKLESFKPNNSLLELNDEALNYVRKFIPKVTKIVSDKSLNNLKGEKGKSITTKVKQFGSKPIKGYQMKYIYYFDKELEKRHKSIAFKDIPDNVKMYKGQKISSAERKALNKSGEVDLNANS
jgi:hypothetical protein